MAKVCSDIQLDKGPTTIYIEGFQAGGGVGMVATYSGPDTAYQEVVIKAGVVAQSNLYSPQCDPTQPFDPSQFGVCIFKSSAGLSSTPVMGIADSPGAKLYFVGKGQMPVVDIDDLDDFRTYVPQTPDSNYAWAIWGQLVISTSGSYLLCITSDDG